MKIDHIRVAMAHAANLSRQRCPGVVLVVADLLGGEVILAHQACSHGVSQPSDALRIEHSCRKLHIVKLNTDTVNDVHTRISDMMYITPPAQRAW